MLKVKVCGVKGFKRFDEAQAAIRLGADAIGLLVGRLHASTDFIDADTAKDIVRRLPPFCSSVLVTHLATPDGIVPLAREIRVSTIQLHGDTSPADALRIREALGNVKLIKSVHVMDETAIATAAGYLGTVDAILLDTANRDTDQIGGTGLTHDWSISRRIVEECGMPVVLAGGLNAANVADAIRAVRPYAVDANSGTKGADGFKDPFRLQAFIEAAKLFN